MWRKWYQFLASRYQRSDWRFMNYGFAESEAQDLVLESEDEQNKYFIQLYHHVACDMSMQNLEVLEVGSGRGGGADYVQRYLQPKMTTGLDFSSNAIKFCDKTYSVDGLSFVCGKAESLQFDENNFDIVINVESSHCYGSVDTFFSEVRRVLKPGGYFIFADFRSSEGLDLLHAQLKGSGMALIKKTDITRQVLAALTLDSQRKKAKIDETVHRFNAKLFYEFAGIEGTKIYQRFLTHEAIYHSFVLQKPA